MSEIRDYRCTSERHADGLWGYRVRATVDGRPVAGWLNVYAPSLTPDIAANLRAHAERNLAHA